jgi:hypothetical protein
VSKTLFNTLAYKELRRSDLGKALIEKSKSEAAKILFDLQSGEQNSKETDKLSAKTIYDAVTLSSSLSIDVNGHQYRLEPYYSDICEDTALAILHDTQASIENSLLEVALMNAEAGH